MSKVIVVNPFGNSKGHSKYYSTSICNSLSSLGIDVILYTSEDFECDSLKKDVQVFLVERVKNSNADKDFKNFIKLLKYGMHVMLGTLRVFKAVNSHNDLKNSTIYIIGGESLISLMCIWIFSWESRIIFTIHNADYSYELYNKISLTKAIYKMINKFLFYVVKSNINHYVVHGDSMKFNFINQLPWLNTSAVISNQLGIDRDYVYENESHLNQSKKIHLLFFGVIRRDKGLFELLNCIRESGNLDIVLTIAGSAGQITESEVIEAIENANLVERVDLILRYIDDKEIPELFENADWVVLPYKSTFNAQSVVITLAAKYLRPVISSDTGQNGFDVKKYRTGLVFNVNQYDELTQILKHLRKPEEAYHVQIKNYLENNSWNNFGLKIKLLC